MSTQYNINLTKGFSYKVRVTLVGQDPDTGAEFPYNLINRTVTAMAKPTANSCKAYSFDVDVIDAVGGVVDLIMPVSVTETITENSLSYDVRITDSTDPEFAYRPLFGTITVTASITE